MTTNAVKNIKFMWKDILTVWSVPKASLLPAVILGSLVIFTYSTLQNYGPQSTLRKFHNAIHNIVQSQSNNKGIPKSDWRDLGSTLEEPIGTPNDPNDPSNPEAMIVFSRVYDQFQMGSTYSLGPMDRRIPREVRIAMVYQRGNQPQAPMVWVIEKPNGGREWKINAHKTLSAMTVP